ncbi:MAG: zinc carboxypeptidase, partial [Cytophagales bacterium]
ASYRSYIIRADNHPDKLKKLTTWLATHHIQFGHGVAKPLRGFDYQAQSVNAFSLSSDDIVINIYQPKGRLVTTLFEPSSRLTDSLTYDITAWNVIYSYDLKAYAVNKKISVIKPYQKKQPPEAVIASKPYAYLFAYKSLQDVELLTALMKRGIKVRKATSTFNLNNQTFEPGTLIVTRYGNEAKPDFDTAVLTLTQQLNRTVFTANTGLASSGADFGSSDVAIIKPPKIAVLGGDQTASLSHGEVWHFFEQQVHYPVSVIGTDHFKGIDLWQYTVLVVPDGNYKLFDEGTLSMVERWVTDGGKLITIANANSAFADKKGFGLKEFTNEDAKKKLEKEEKDANEKSALLKYQDAERRNLSNSIFGAIYKLPIDNTHPLAFGLGSHYFSMRTNTLRFGYLEKGWNVATMRGKQKPLIGFAGVQANKELENSLVFGVEDKGKGKVVYLVDNPLFRAFWENGKMVFANAVFMVGN